MMQPSVQLAVGLLLLCCASSADGSGNLGSSEIHAKAGSLDSRRLEEYKLIVPGATNDEFADAPHNDGNGGKKRNRGGNDDDVGGDGTVADDGPHNNGNDDDVGDDGPHNNGNDDDVGDDGPHNQGQGDDDFGGGGEHQNRNRDRDGAAANVMTVSCDSDNPDFDFMVQPSSDAKFYWKISPDGASMVSRLVRTGSPGYFAIGPNSSARMVGTDAVFVLPGEGIFEYDVSGKKLSEVTRRSIQSLTNASVQDVGGVVTADWTRPLAASTTQGTAQDISADGTTTFVWALSSSNSYPSMHDNNGAFSVQLAACQGGAQVQIGTLGGAQESSTSGSSEASKTKSATIAVVLSIILLGMAMAVVFVRKYRQPSTSRKQAEKIDATTTLPSGTVLSVDAAGAA